MNRVKSPNSSKQAAIVRKQPKLLFQLFLIHFTLPVRSINFLYQHTTHRLINSIVKQQISHFLFTSNFCYLWLESRFKKKVCSRIGLTNRIHQQKHQLISNNREPESNPWGALKIWRHALKYFYYNYDILKEIHSQLWKSILIDMIAVLTVSFAYSRF